MKRKDNNLGAIIIGGSFHSLGAARNLAKHDVPVIIIDCGVCVSQFSRHITKFYKYSPLIDDAEFIKFLLRIAKENYMENWVIFPSTDDSVRILAQNHHCLSEYFHLTIPPWKTTQYLYDKKSTYTLAEKCDVPVPKTYYPKDVDEAMSLDLDFPLILKPTISKQFMSATKKKAIQVNNRYDLSTIYTNILGFINPSQLMLQELIPGGAKNLFSYVGFFKDGIPIVGFSARRLRQHPMDFGRASTYVITIHQPELQNLAEKYLKEINYTGLAEVEFMFDTKDKRFELLEVNPRIWGWHTLAIHAGLDLPYLAYADAIGMEVSFNSAREGVKWVRFITDFPTVMSEIIAGRMSMSQYLESLSGELEFSVLSLKDPLPFIADIFLAPYNYFKNRGF